MRRKSAIFTVRVQCSCANDEAIDASLQTGTLLARWTRTSGGYHVLRYQGRLHYDELPRLKQGVWEMLALIMQPLPITEEYPPYSVPKWAILGGFGAHDVTFQALAWPFSTLFSLIILCTREPKHNRSTSHGRAYI